MSRAIKHTHRDTHSKQMQSLFAYERWRFKCTAILLLASKMSIIQMTCHYISNAIIVMHTSTDQRIHRHTYMKYVIVNLKWPPAHSHWNVAHHVKYSDKWSFHHSIDANPLVNWFADFYNAALRLNYDAIGLHRNRSQLLLALISGAHSSIRKFVYLFWVNWFSFVCVCFVLTA